MRELFTNRIQRNKRARAYKMKTYKYNKFTFL